MLFAPPKLKPSFPRLREDSNNGSIEMVYQGSMKANVSESSETQTTNGSDAQTEEKQVQTASSSNTSRGTCADSQQVQQQRCDEELTARVKQELRVGEQPRPSAVTTESRAHLKPDASSSKLTDMLSGAAPRTDSNGDFRAFCPSAVPSPLHRLPGPHVLMTPTPMLRGGNGTPIPVPFANSPSRKTIEEHFFMTNEHLDVVGKTTYDTLGMFTEQQMNATNAKHEQLVAIIEKHVEGLQCQVNLVNDKADDAANQTHNVSLKLDQLEKFLKDEVISVMKEQTMKIAEVDSNIKEIQKAMAHVQQTVGKLSEFKSAWYHPTAGTLPAPGAASSTSHVAPTHHSQPALNGHYATDVNRHEQPPMPTQKRRNASDNYESHGDPRSHYGHNWQSQAWNGRPTYHGGNKAETPSYAGTNPYHFGNGGQYNNGYMSGYAPYNFSPASAEQSYPHGQKPAQ